MAYQVSFEAILRGLRERLDDDDLAEVCDLLVWRTADNGSELMRVCEDWLRRGTAEEVSAALAINGGVHFTSRSEWEAEMLGAADRHPWFRDRIERILRDWYEKRKAQAVREVLRNGTPLSFVARGHGVTEEELQGWVDEHLESRRS
ncbi:transposase [Actinomadura kijaniata]|uniref:transposase n=1 Tax=Actinomadura kijaniata TaxID=46161 RepID=UPI0008334987|nr:transposase [Actinomadura kijaniata]